MPVMTTEKNVTETLVVFYRMWRDNFADPAFTLFHKGAKQQFTQLQSCRDFAEKHGYKKIMVRHH